MARSRLFPLLLAAMLPCVQAAASPRIAGIAPIALHDGVNVVPGFMTDGAAATIVQAWRGNGNAHGHDDWLVLSPAGEDRAVSVVTYRAPGDPVARDLVMASPFDGERVLSTVRFARATVDGRPASLMIDAVLDPAPDGVPADHATATISLYALVRTDGAPGESPQEFRPVATIRSTARFCNADLALSKTLGVRLPDSYNGFNRTDGCPSAG